MENELVKSNLPEIDYDNEKLQLIKSMFAIGADDNEFKLLIYMSKKYRLDILTKQIWCVKFAGKPAQIYSGRDGFLEVAQGYSVFDGMETILQIVNEPFKVTYWDKETKKQGTFGRDFQYAATCTVYRKDRSHPISVMVYESEYTTGRNLWVTKPRTMIGKVAESQCLRKSFSISGLYSPEEMEQWEAEQNGKFTITQEAPKVTVVTAPKTAPKPSKSTKTTNVSDDKYNPNTYVIGGGKHKSELMKDTSASYINWNIGQINDGKYDPSKYGIDTKKYIDMLFECLAIATAREDSRNKPDTNTPDVEDITEAEFEKLQEEFPVKQEVLIK